MSAIDQLIIDNDAALQADTISTKNIRDRVDAITRELRPYAVFTAIIAQGGTDAPSASILENSLGEVPTFDRTDVGRYGLNITGGYFDINFTWASVSSGDAADLIKRHHVRWENGSRLVIVQSDGSDYMDGIDRLYLEVRVYPAPSR